MFGGGSPSLADIAAVTRNNEGGNGGNNGWGDGNGWWVLIILFALFGGWGRGYGNGNGDGGNSGGGSNTTTIVPVPMGGYGMMNGCCSPCGGYAGEIQRGFDTAAITSQLNGINSGICSLGYDQLAQMNGINSNIMQTGFGITNAIQANTVAGMQNTNALQTQLAQCCCDNKAAVAQVRYDMATNTCATNHAIADAAQSIIQNDNANYRQLHDEITQIQINNMKEKIAEQNNLINALNLSASQANQNNVIRGYVDNAVNQLTPPKAVPSWNVPSPFQSYCGCGNNNGCGGCC